jgi:hypothetical protein
MTYADYNYYLNYYGGSLSDDLFSFYIIKASKEIDKNVNKVLTSLETLTEQEQDNIKYVACSLVDYFNANKQTAYSSLSIDGVSKTVKNNDVLLKEKADILDSLPQSLTRYL